MGCHESVMLVEKEDVASHCSVGSVGECVVCFEDRVLLKSPMCGHEFCEECTNKCKNKCPMCPRHIVDGMTSEQLEDHMMIRIKACGLGIHI